MWFLGGVGYGMDGYLRKTNAINRLWEMEYDLLKRIINHMITVDLLPLVTLEEVVAGMITEEADHFQGFLQFFIHSGEEIAVYCATTTFRKRNDNSVKTRRSFRPLRLKKEGGEILFESGGRFSLQYTAPL
jgi:hypothetical protein